LPYQAALQAVIKLLLWHALQPVLYAYVFYDAFSMLEPVQRWLGGFVLLREVLYMLAVLACTTMNPAFLLVDVAASVRGGSTRVFSGGYTFLAMYVVAPEKYVTLALLGEGGLSKPCLAETVVIIVSPVLDLCGLCALVAGIGAGGLPLALAASYSVTALGALFMVGAFVVGGIKNRRVGRLLVGLTALMVCVLPVLMLFFAWGRWSDIGGGSLAGSGS
jgi:hypothetical protein